MAKVIDLDFYRKFRIILPVRLSSTQQRMYKEQSHFRAGQQTKRVRRKRKIEVDAKITKKE